MNPLLEQLVDSKLVSPIYYQDSVCVRVRRACTAYSAPECRDLRLDHWHGLLAQWLNLSSGASLTVCMEIHLTWNGLSKPSFSPLLMSMCHEIHLT
jgi:hypothetical protein